jgi:predicted hydrocarbon binding protein
MAANAHRPAEFTLPVSALAALREMLAAEVGTEAAAVALRAAGSAAGAELLRILGGPRGTAELEALPADQFWSRLSLLFSSRGWGQLGYTEAHPGVGSLESGDWAEADATAVADQPSCHLTTGLLAHVLGQLAGAEVAVLEVECRTRGDARCRFLFGGTDAVFGVYRQLADGASADAALQQIG